MQVHEVGAHSRRKLGLIFQTEPVAKPQPCASPTLSHHELSRLVAEMVD
jgi:hypothetical protein